jgi:DNA uptake protein ComE-like DNA-binding protein
VTEPSPLGVSAIQVATLGMVNLMATPPVLSPEQRTAALAKAAEARTARAELKNKLKMGSLTLHEALSAADTDTVVGKLKVQSLLESLPGVGKVKARRLMEDIGISDTRRVKGLGPQQREALLTELAS